MCLLTIRLIRIVHGIPGQGRSAQDRTASGIGFIVRYARSERAEHAVQEGLRIAGAGLANLLLLNLPVSRAPRDLL